MHKFLTLTVAGLCLLTLAGCSAISAITNNPIVVTADDVVSAQPPVASKMAPYCSDNPSTPADTVLCKEYEAMIVTCELNISAIGGVLSGASLLVPGYGPAIAEAVGSITPIISSDQVAWCTTLGYVTTSTNKSLALRSLAPMVVAPAGTTYIYDPTTGKWIPSLK